MLLTAYLDESGTHDTSPISIMAGYLGTAEQWGAFDAEWMALLQRAGVWHVHAVDLFKRTRAFKGWPAEKVNAFAVQLDGVIARHLQLGFSVIVRDNDYRTIYAEGPKPRRSRLDSKMACAFGPALPLCHPLSPRNCGSRVKGKAHAKQQLISYWRKVTAISAMPGGCSSSSRPMRCPNGTISSAFSTCRRRTVPALRRPIFSPIAFIKLSFSNMGPRLRRLRSRPMSPRRLLLPTFILASQCRDLARWSSGSRLAKTCCVLSRRTCSPRQLVRRRPHAPSGAVRRLRDSCSAEGKRAVGTVVATFPAAS